MAEFGIGAHFIKLVSLYHSSNFVAAIVSILKNVPRLFLYLLVTLSDTFSDINQIGLVVNNQKCQKSWNIL